MNELRIGLRHHHDHRLEHAHVSLDLALPSPSPLPRFRAWWQACVYVQCVCARVYGRMYVRVSVCVPWVHAGCMRMPPCQPLCRCNNLGTKPFDSQTLSPRISSRTHPHPPMLQCNPMHLAPYTICTHVAGHSREQPLGPLITVSSPAHSLSTYVPPPFVSQYPIV